MERMHDPAHPGEILREELEARGATITAAARALGVTRKALSDVVNLKAGVSPVMAFPVRTCSRWTKLLTRSGMYSLRYRRGGIRMGMTLIRKYRSSRNCC